VGTWLMLGPHAGPAHQPRSRPPVSAGPQPRGRPRFTRQTCPGRWKRLPYRCK